MKQVAELIKDNTDYIDWLYPLEKDVSQSDHVRYTSIKPISPS